MTSARFIVIAVLALLLSGCTTVIVPPPQSANTVRVYVLDHGRHASLLLPANEGGAVRYSYGDWDYYVLRKTRLSNGLRALFRPTPAALGRQALPKIDPAADDVVEQLHARLAVELLAAHAVPVPRAAADALLNRLEGEFAAAARNGRARWPDDNVYFVPHPVDYTLSHNSNHMVGQWLDEMGCKVRGRPVLSDWRITLPADGP